MTKLTDKMLIMCQHLAENGITFSTIEYLNNYCIDVNTGMKSHMYVTELNGELVAYRRYQRVDTFSSFDELVGLVSECTHGRDFMNEQWANLLTKKGYSLN